MNSKLSKGIVRELAYRSPLILAKIVDLNFDDIVYNEWERDLVTLPNRSIFLKPRGTYKSSIYTILYPVWCLIQNPNLRFVIRSRTETIAKMFLKKMIENYFSNEKFIYYFGNFLPRTKDGRIKAIRGNTLNIINHYDKVKAGESIRVYGMDSSLTAIHCDRYIVDDACDEGDKFSPTVRDNRITTFQQDLSILDPGGKLIVVGTPKHIADLYGYIINVVNPHLRDEYKYLVRVDSPYNIDGSLRYPTVLSHNELENKKIEMGLKMFSHEILCHPLADDDVLFKLDQFKTFNRYELIDSVAKEIKEIRDKNNISTRHVVGKSNLIGWSLNCYIDPSLSGKGDYTALSLGLNKRDEKPIYLLEALLLPSSQGLVNEILKLHTKYIELLGIGISLVYIERNNFQEFLRRQVRDAILNKDMPIQVIGVLNTKNKYARINIAQIFVENGTIHIDDNWNKYYYNYMRQLLNYPTDAHDDAPDSLSGLIDMTTGKVSNIIKSLG